MTHVFRKVSGGEKFFIAVNEVRPPFVIQLVLEGTGDPTPEDLYAALEKTTAKNPGSSLKLSDADEPLSWEIGPPPTLTIVDAPTFTADHEADAPFLMWPLDPHTGPTCELVFVRGRERNYLVFRALHAVMDGQGTLLWVKDFMRCLRNETPVGHSSNLDFDTLLERITTDKKPLPDIDALHPFGMPRSDGEGRYFWRRVRVDRPLNSLAVGRIAAVLAAQARQHGVGPVRLNLPTDIRHYIPKERTTGNFFNTLYMDVPENVSAESLGLRVVHMLYKDEGKKTLGMFTSFDAGSLAAYKVKVLWDFAHLHDTGRYAFSATLSHLGRLSGEALSAPSFETKSAVFVPLVGDSGCVVALNGFDNHTVVAVGLSDRFHDDDQVDQLAQWMRDALTD